MQLRKPPARRQSIAVAAALAAALTVVAVGVARAATTVKPSDPGPSVVSLRSLVGHYRTVTWTSSARRTCAASTARIASGARAIAPICAG